MRVFVAGATGAIGRPLVALLLEAGHDVAAMTRSPERAAALRARGVDAVVADALDPDGTRRAIVAARPEVVVHQLTDLPGPHRPAPLRARRRTDVAPARGHRPALRPRRARGRRAAPRGPVGLVRHRAAGAAGPRRGRARGEPTRPGRWAASCAGRSPSSGRSRAPRRSRASCSATGSSTAPGRPTGRAGRSSRTSAGGGCRSWARAPASPPSSRSTTPRPPRCSRSTARRRGSTTSPTTSPIAQRDWVRVLADALGAPAPCRIPLWLARLVAGPVATAAVTARGASNAKARRELGWAPRWPSVREGFPAVLAADPQGAAGAGRRAALPGAGLGGAG